MPKVQRQRGAASVARAGLQSGYLPALHRPARGDGRLVAHQPAIEADQDRRPRRASRPHHHLPTGRGGRHRPDGARRPGRDPPIASTSVMRVTAIHAQTERKRQDKSVRCAEKHRRRAKTGRPRGPIRPVPTARATADAGRGAKRLSSARIQAFSASECIPLGECREKNGQEYRCGQQASFALVDMVGQAVSRCEPNGVDRYKRIIGVCFKGDQDLNRWMVRNGWAVAYRRYSKDYITDEESASSAGIGIWAGQFETPENWRK